jgi:hypothetical protein
VTAPTARPWVLDSVGTTLYAADRHTGVAAFGPDPLCREHYQGGPNGHYFAPAESVAERQANARLVLEAVTRYDELLLVLKDYLQLCPAFRMKPIGSPGSAARAQQDDHIALEDRARAITNRLKWVRP